MRHIVSFFRSPLGYIANLIGTLLCYAPRCVENALGGPVARMCEAFCAHDGVQDDPLF